MANKKYKIKKLIDFSINTSSKIGKILEKLFRKEKPFIRGTSKEIKTFYDELTDEIIKKSIERNFKDHSYLTEETGLVDKNSDYLWIIDPLDGTGNFVNHNPFFSVSIALWYKGEPLLGIIESPILKERFVAIKNKGAFHYDLNKKIKKSLAQLSIVSNLNESYVIYCEGSEKDKSRITKLFSNIYPFVKEVRKLGSAALELAWIALGRAEIYYTTKISLWDIASGIIFVSEAGGKIFKFDGSQYKWNDFYNNPLNKFDLIATKENLIKKFTNLIRGDI
ncbi:MAG: inositol monophosphatase [Candidatus Parcubacteria bacterium]|nr:MAG: inositol monophosphatase [Candidatus Parcubacteria bacterium]